MKTLYVSDMDGTLLGSDSRISARTANIISDLTRKGALITVATARTPATVVPLLAGVQTIPPAIVMTGAALWDRDPGSFSDVHLIDCDLRHDVESILRRHAVSPFIYTPVRDSFLDVYHEGQKLNRQEEKFVTDRIGLTLKCFHLKSKAPDNARVILFYATGDKNVIFEAGIRLKEQTGCSVFAYSDIFDHGMAHLEVFAHGVSKAAAVRSLKKRLCVDRVVAFGDNLNDLPMLEAADYAVAVGNAFDEVKQAADAVIGPNTADSVAEFIMKDFGNIRD